MKRNLEVTEVPVPGEVAKKAEERSARYESVFGEELDREVLIVDILVEQIFEGVQSES